MNYYQLLQREVRKRLRRDADIPDDEIIFRTAENGKVYAINQATGETSGLGPELDKSQNGNGKSAGHVSDETRKAAEAHGIDIDETVRSPEKDSDWTFINPRVGTSDEFDNNCAHCAVCFELRRRGMDVTAAPIDGMHQRELAKKFKGFKWESLTAKRKKSSKAELDQALSKLGDGARGIVYVWWDGKSWGHFFNFEVVGGTARYFDGQEDARDVEAAFTMCRPSKTQYARTDNLELNEDTFSCVENRKKGRS